MNNRERTLATLNFASSDRLPLVHFGFWGETMQKWLDEGHFTLEELGGFPHNISPQQEKLCREKLGFDFGWECWLPGTFFLDPPFEREVLEVKNDDTRLVRNQYGATELESNEAGSIPAEVDHLLKDRASWEQHFKPRLQFSPERLDLSRIRKIIADPAYGWEDNPRGLFCGSLFGRIRNTMGVVGISMLYYDDEPLFREIIDTVGELTYRYTKAFLELEIQFDYAHFWEDICFKNGPLVVPEIFAEYVGPHYRQISELLHRYNVRLISVDCDGEIDALAPIWLDNGVNVMFPIEVGTWGGNIGRLRQKYGPELRGVGGMNKHVFAADYAAVDREIERLRPMVEDGGYIPCPDHRIAPDAKWENVQYYCQRMREVFG